MHQVASAGNKKGCGVARSRDCRRIKGNWDAMGALKYVSVGRNKALA
jgi:hypothetical protein